MSTTWDNAAKVHSVRLGNSTIFQGVYKWVISPFNIADKNPRQSSKFSIEGFGRDEFYFQMERHVEDHPSQKVVFKLSLKRTGLEWTLCICTIEFSLLVRSNYTADYFRSRSANNSFSESTTPEIKFASEHDLQSTISDWKLGNTLTILCKFQLTKTLEEVNAAHASMNLSHTMKSLLDNQTYADVTLQIGDKCLKAHKAILTSRSPVFAAMFENEMKESKENKVDITDVSEDVFEAFLTYIYTDVTPNLDKFAIGLLGAANKYNVDGLKRRCEEYLIENITVENAAELLINADLLDAKELKKKIMQFINFCRNDFVKTEGYKELKESHAKFVFEIFEELQLQ